VPGRNAAFRRALSEQGFVEGRSVEILYRWADLHAERLPALVADLVSRRVSVIFANNINAAEAAKAATATNREAFRDSAADASFGDIHWSFC
jgi:putative tryptophan/tyrosine transport system substrate-binding protein